MTPENPALINELRALRQRKGELEGHLGALQDSRRQLMEQLEGLMRMLKNQQTSSPRSTPNSSPRSGKSPPMPGGGMSATGSGGVGAGVNILGTSPMSSSGAGSGLHAAHMGAGLRMQQNPSINPSPNFSQQQQNQLDQMAVGGPYGPNGTGSKFCTTILSVLHVQTNKIRLI